MSDMILDADDADDDGPSAPRWVVPLVIVAILAGVGWGVSKLMHTGSGEPKHQTVKIAVLPDTPPPPPPPPEKKMEPEVKDIKPQPQQEEQPKPMDKAPEPEQIKMEGAAGDGPSAFGAGAVAKEYQGGDPGTGIGGGVNKMQFALFGSQLQRHVQSSLAKNANAKFGDYRVNVQVWISPSGDLRVELLSSTGDDKADEALKQALTQLPPMQNVPTTLPQPIRLRISNRMTG